MKKRTLAIIVSTIFIATGCANVASWLASTSETATPTRRVSPDYLASENAKGLRAFPYGKVTLLDVGNESVFFLGITDNEGNAVVYERTGQYYRIGKRLDAFTVSINGRNVAFERIKKTTSVQAVEQTIKAGKEVVAYPLAMSLEQTIKTGREVEAPYKLAMSLEQAIKTGRAIAAISDSHKQAMALAAQQDTETRLIIDRAGLNPETAGSELWEVTRRLDQNAALNAKGDVVILCVRFNLGQSNFNPDPELKAAILAIAGQSTAIKIRGRTDAKTAQPIDGPLAAARAANAKAFLVKHGIRASIIEKFSLSAGDFIAPDTPEGKAINRRVEIEFTIPKIEPVKA